MFIFYRISIENKNNLGAACAQTVETNSYTKKSIRHKLKDRSDLTKTFKPASKVS